MVNILLQNYGEIEPPSAVAPGTSIVGTQNLYLTVTAGEA
jgi:hypothetical protein